MSPSSEATAATGGDTDPGRFDDLKHGSFSPWLKDTYVERRILMPPLCSYNTFNTNNFNFNTTLYNTYLDLGGGRDEVTTGGDEDEVAVRERFTAAGAADEVVHPDAAVEEEEEATEHSAAAAAAVEVRKAVERESAGFCTAMI